MAYVSYRTGATSSASSGASVTFTVGSLGPGSLLVVAAGTSTTAKTISSIATATGGGTFSLVVAKNGANVRNCLWIGRGFTGYPTDITVTFSQSTGAHCVVAYILDVSSDLTSAPAVTANAGSTGTSVTADSGTVTPTSGDVVIAAATWANGTASSARTPTGYTFLNNGEVNQSTSLRTALAWCQTTGTTATGLAWTIASAEWAAAAAAITLSADAAAATGMLCKGRLTAALDQAATA